jgi:hypothetical protein
MTGDVDHLHVKKIKLVNFLYSYIEDAYSGADAGAGMQDQEQIRFP